jgi:S-adenosylmethionine:tRNA ribosyltransferase-isomerase
MKLSDFNYHLPQELIAQSWIEPRDNSRLLVLNKSESSIKDKKFYNILEELNENDVLVINKTRVINARLHWVIAKWRKTASSKENEKDLYKVVEIFLHKQLSEETWECRVYPWKNLKPWKKILFYSTISKNKSEETIIMEAEVIESTFTWRIIKFNKKWIDFFKTIETLWKIPLPPYIKEELEDSERYQTVWSQIEWSVAAPTASLHFTTELLEKIKEKWVKVEKVLLHIWLGTFMPILTENILDHNIHWEYIELEKDVSERLNKYKLEWKRIIAVWTTSVRVLESFSDDKWVLTHWSKDTNIFIYPWYKWKFVMGLITNFHLPQSTLLMLVSSFAWEENIKKSYKHAVKEKYRFFSFGDAMFIK